MAIACSLYRSVYSSLEKIKSMEECLKQQRLLLSALAVSQDLATCLEEVFLTSKFHPLSHSFLQNSNIHKY
jgi:hypothetical protein